MPSWGPNYRARGWNAGVTTSPAAPTMKSEVGAVPGYLSTPLPCQPHVYTRPTTTRPYHYGSPWSVHTCTRPRVPIATNTIDAHTCVRDPRTCVRACVRARAKSDCRGITRGKKSRRLIASERPRSPLFPDSSLAPKSTFGEAAKIADIYLDVFTNANIN